MDRHTHMCLCVCVCVCVCVTERANIARKKLKHFPLFELEVFHPEVFVK